jgi:hypothetical protein
VQLVWDPKIKEDFHLKDARAIREKDPMMIHQDAMRDLVFVADLKRNPVLPRETLAHKK